MNRGHSRHSYPWWKPVPRLILKGGTRLQRRLEKRVHRKKARKYDKDIQQELNGERYGNH